MQTFDELERKGPFDSGRPTWGFAIDLFFLTPETIKGVFTQVKEKGGQLITTHVSMFLGNVAQTLKLMDLLDDNVIIPHGGKIRSADAELIKAAGAHISSTPSTELQIAVG